MTRKSAQGLHLYANTTGPDTLAEHGVFYSRRGGGPYYRWDYDEKIKRWHGSRVILDPPPKSLRVAANSVPVALRVELLGHYQD